MRGGSDTTRADVCCLLRFPLGGFSRRVGNPRITDFAFWISKFASFPQSNGWKVVQGEGERGRNRAADKCALVSFFFYCSKCFRESCTPLDLLSAHPFHLDVPDALRLCGMLREAWCARTVCWMAHEHHILPNTQLDTPKKKKHPPSLLVTSLLLSPSVSSLFASFSLFLFPFCVVAQGRLSAALAPVLCRQRGNV